MIAERRAVTTTTSSSCFWRTADFLDDDMVWIERRGFEVRTDEFIILPVFSKSHASVKPDLLTHGTQTLS